MPKASKKKEKHADFSVRQTRMDVLTSADTRRKPNSS